MYIQYPSIRGKNNKNDKITLRVFQLSLPRT